MDRIPRTNPITCKGLIFYLKNVTDAINMITIPPAEMTGNMTAVGKERLLRNITAAFTMAFDTPQRAAGQSAPLVTETRSFLLSEINDAAAMTAEAISSASIIKVSEYCDGTFVCSSL